MKLEKTNLGPILNGPFLFNHCHSKAFKNQVKLYFYVNWTNLLSCYIFQCVYLKFQTQLKSCVVKLCSKFEVKILEMQQESKRVHLILTLMDFTQIYLGTGGLDKERRARVCSTVFHKDHYRNSLIIKNSGPPGTPQCTRRTTIDFF